MSNRYFLTKEKTGVPRARTPVGQYLYEEVSAIQPLKAGPMSVKEMVLRVAIQAPHRLVLVSPVLETHERPSPLRRCARRLSAPGAILAGPVA